jgi:hypothetical protein
MWSMAARSTLSRAARSAATREEEFLDLLRESTLYLRRLRACV